MTLQNFNEWVNTNKNLNENMDDIELKNARLNAKFPNFVKMLDSISTLNPADAQELVSLLVPLIQHKAHWSASKALGVAKTAMSNSNEPQKGGAPGAPGTQAK